MFFKSSALRITASIALTVAATSAFAGEIAVKQVSGDVGGSLVRHVDVKLNGGARR